MTMLMAVQPSSLTFAHVLALPLAAALVSMSDEAVREIDHAESYPRPPPFHSQKSIAIVSGRHDELNGHSQDNLTCFIGSLVSSDNLVDEREDRLAGSALRGCWRRVDNSSHCKHGRQNGCRSHDTTIDARQSDE